MTATHTNYLEKQYAQTHSNMPVVRRIQHIKSAHSLWKCVEHVQYPGLRIPSMELQALEWIRAHMHHVLLPGGLDEHARTSMNDHLGESTMPIVGWDRAVLMSADRLPHQPDG